MKTILFLFFICVSTFVFAQEQKSLNWISFEEAVKQNQKVPKKIFVDLYTSWCGWCKRQDATTFVDSAIVKYMNEKFYSVKLNAETRDTIRFNNHDFLFIPERKTHELAISLMQNKLNGYPSSSFLNEKLEIISIYSGYLSPENFLPMVKYFGDNFHLTQSWDEFLKSFPKKEK